MVQHAPATTASARTGHGIAFATRLAAVVLIVVGSPPSAAASENYPGIIDATYDTECPRPLTRCLICHTTAAGGEETASRPFAVTLRDYGLTEGKSGRKLSAALNALPTDQDSDEDGAPDHDELAACMNPSGEELSDGPGFGCAPRLAPRVGSGLDRWAATLALGVLAALTRRRRGPARDEAAA